MLKKKPSCAIVGTVGVPAMYGGFETLVENLVGEDSALADDFDCYVYCSAPAYKERRATHRRASLRYVAIRANGISSIFYDMISMADAARRGVDVILVLGVSGALLIPVLRLCTKSVFVCNVDGVEWKRAKWSPYARFFLRLCERVAAKTSHGLIADNEGIFRHLYRSYNVTAEIIAYGGDHAVECQAKPVDFDLPARFALSVCRIEPENNIEMILSAFVKLKTESLVLIGNWMSSEFGKGLRDKYSAFPNILLVDPIYDVGQLKFIRSRAEVYLHGHMAGGTNPSLVEMMHFGIPIFAFDCEFNRFTLGDSGSFFDSADAIVTLYRSKASWGDGSRSKELATERYTWKVIADRYAGYLKTFI